jgi:hypothetical protein
VFDDSPQCHVSFLRHQLGPRQDTCDDCVLENKMLMKMLTCHLRSVGYFSL